MSALTDATQVALARLDALAQITAEPGHMTRLAFSPEMARANALVADWFRAAGATKVHEDAAGNLIGRWGGDGPALALGSHLDTVPDGGIYDGVLGVVLALGAVEAIGPDALPCPVEILCFGDEEGVRFGTSVAGSLAVSGRTRDGALEAADGTGVTLRRAITDYGLDPDGLLRAARGAGDYLAYIEAHIEQGPVLDRASCPVAVVTGIAGSTRAVFAITGEAGHAGTVPMSMRHDALLAASELALAIETVALSHDVLATCGTLSVSPGAVNTVAGRAELSLDLRSGNDVARTAALSDILAAATDIATRRKLTIAPRLLSQADSAPCAPSLSDGLHAAARACGQNSVPDLLSGAGHDGAHMRDLCPYGMLFIRCRDGISHAPGEYARPEDIAVAQAVMTRFVRDFTA